jgi:hypothetical protein
MQVMLRTCSISPYATKGIPDHQNVLFLWSKIRKSASFKGNIFTDLEIKTGQAKRKGKR